MDDFDYQIKQRLIEEVRELSLADNQKANIQAAMNGELNNARCSTWRRLSARLALFWESTHEVSLAPVAVVCMLLVVTGVGALRQVPSQKRYETVKDVYFVRQAGGGIEIVPLPEDMEAQ